MAQSKQATETRSRDSSGRFTKAQVDVPVPGRIQANIFSLGLKPDGQKIAINPTRKARYTTYYEMYRQHPTLRAGIEKIAKVTVANGFRFIAEDADIAVDQNQVKELRRFFRASNAHQLLRDTYRDLMIYGEAFWLIEKRLNKKPIRARRLHPYYMDEGTVVGEITGWRFGPIQASDKATEYKADQVIQFKFDDPDNDTRGLSLLASLELTVASDLFAMKYNEKFFENSARTGIIFNMKGATEAEVKRNRAWLELNYVGVEAAHRPILLEGGLEVQKSVSTRAEMEFIEGRRFNRQEILSVLDIDPTKLGINENSNRSVSKEADNTFRQENISPLQLVVEEEISNRLIMEMFGYDDILFRQNDSSRRDLLESMKAYGDGERMGVFTINGIRNEFGMPKITGGDVAFVQTAAGAIPVEWLDDVAKRLITVGPGGVQTLPPVDTGSPAAGGGDQGAANDQPAG
jgi:HK97 family phage portal protein